MASNVTVTHNFVAGTSAVADNVDQNFSDITTWVNTNAVHLDGSKAFTGIPSAPSSNPTTANQLARKAYVDGVAGLPIGSVAMWAGTVAPAGYLLCRGQAVLRGSYVDLFTAIGTTYGAGDGSTTFNLPNLQGRVPVGLDSGQTEFDALAETGGAKTHTLLAAEMPSHTHVQNPHTHIQDSHVHNAPPGSSGLANGYVLAQSTGVASFDLGNGGTNILDATNNATTAAATAVNQNTTAVNQNTGGGGAHNNLQPYIVLNYMIRAI